MFATPEFDIATTTGFLFDVKPYPSHIGDLSHALPQQTAEDDLWRRSGQTVRLAILDKELGGFLSATS